MAQMWQGRTLVCLVLLNLLSFAKPEGKRYEPNWASLDSRPLPDWYDQGKIGIFIHWGVFSVPSFRTEWFWELWKGPKPDASVVKFMEDNYKPDWTYADFAKEFTVQEGIFDPDHWAEVFNASGARYVVHVAKHIEGFTSWPSNHSFSWNAMDVGPRRDLVGEVSTAVRKYPNLRYGIYHALYEWFNPFFIRDKENHFTTQDFVKYKSMPELYELVNTYHPEIIWSDAYNGGNSTYWNSTYFLAWLYNDSPVKDTVVTNDRWGTDANCRHGGFLNCHDKYDPGVLQKRKFEDAISLDLHSWGYRRTIKLSEVMAVEDLIHTLIKVVSCNGNLLINVGPTKDGVLPILFEERLRQFGSWLEVNGEAIYYSRPWQYQNDTINSNVWYTQRTFGSSISFYACLLVWPDGNVLELGAPSDTKTYTITLLGWPHGSLNYTFVQSTKMNIYLPTIPFNQMASNWAWVFKFVSH